MEWPLRIANHEGPIDEDTWGIRLDEASVKVEEEAGTVHSHIDMLAHISRYFSEQRLYYQRRLPS